MNKSEFQILGRHIFEFRYDPIISFNDWKGALAEHLIHKLNFNGFRLIENRIDLINPDERDFQVFVSMQNTGVLIENNSNFPNVKDKILKFLSALSEFEKFKPKKIVRFGFRSNFFKQKKGTSFSQIKEAFEEHIIFLNKSPYNNFEEKIVDIGLPINFKGEKYNFNIVHGPMEQSQAVGQFFNNIFVYRDNFGKPKDFVPKQGLFFDIDVFKIDEEEISYDNLKEKTSEFADVANNKFEIISNELFSKIP